MARKNRKHSTTRRLHRWIGAGAALFVIFMAFSGMVINHSSSLNLDQKHVSFPALLGWYGLAKPAYIQSHAASDRWLSFAGSRLYLDGSFVTTVADGVGAVFDGEKYIAAGEHEILLIDNHGRLIEKQAWNQPGGMTIEAIGLIENRTVTIKTAAKLWFADTELLNWQPLADITEEPLWSIAGTAPESVQQAITRHYRGDGLSVERVLLDLHSGRIFGRSGVLVYDLFALLTGFLAITGLVLWVKNFQKKKGKNNQAGF